MAGNAIAGMALDAAGSVVNNLNNELQMERTFGYNERAAKMQTQEQEHYSRTCTVQKQKSSN